jgi:hypothetical protein
MKTLESIVVAVCAALFVHGTSFAAQVNLTWAPKLSQTITYAIGLNPLDTNMIYTQKAGVFYVSHDKGNTWQARGSGFPVDQVRNITINPSDTNSIILAGFGVWKSPDGGWTWSQTLSNVQIDGESIDYNYQNPRTVYFVDFNLSRFFISKDKGDTWTQRSTVSFGNVCTIGSDPNDSNIILVGAGDTRIARSTDQGLSWSLVKTGNPYFSECPKLVWDKIHPNLVYAAMQADKNYSFFKSSDAGATWQDIGLYGSYMWGLDTDPASGDIYIGTFGEFPHSGDYRRVGVFRSADQGRSWQRVGNIIGYPTADMNVWMIKAARDHSVYILNHPSFFDNQGAVYSVNTSGLGAVKGVITSSVTSTPITHANIIVQETGDSIIINNDDGSFQCSLPAGIYTLVCKTSGVQQVVSNITVTANSEITQNFQLALNNQMSSITGTISNSFNDTIVSIVNLYETFGNGSSVILTDTVTSSFSFTNISSLNTYDSIVVTPLTLPYFPRTIVPLVLGSHYDVPLERADVLIINDPDRTTSSPGSVYAPYYQNPLAQAGITSAIWNTDERGGVIPTDVVAKTSKNTVLWLTRKMNHPLSGALHDSLTAMIDHGYHVILGGQNLAELDSGTVLFKNRLKIGFHGNYTQDATIQGFPGNIISDGLNFSVSQASVASRDRITLLDTNHVFKALWYGASDNSILGGAYVDSTENSGKAVFFGFDLYPVTPSVLKILFQRSLAYFDNTKPFVLTAAVLQNPALPRYIDLVVASTIPLQSAPSVQLWLVSDTTNLVMTPVNGSAVVYKASYELPKGGYYFIRTRGHSSRGEDTTVMRAFDAVFAKPGQAAAVAAMDGKALLKIGDRAIQSETCFLADYTMTDKETVYRFGPDKDFSEPLSLEIHYDDQAIDPRKLFIYHMGIGGWRRLPSTVLFDRHAIQAEVVALGEFKVGYDAAAEINNPVVSDFSLKQNYPNPFNPSTTIEYDLPQDGYVILTIYNMLGQRVRTLLKGQQSAGRHHRTWDAKNDQGSTLASGIYLYRIQTEKFKQTKKMMMLK